MPPGRKPRLLVTGFGPFPGIPKNPSAALASRIQAAPRWARLGIEARATILTTSYRAMARELEPAIREAAPDAILMIGVAGRAKGLRVEARAVNRTSILAPDAVGFRPTTLTIESGVTARLTRARTAAAVTLLRRAGCRVRLSQDAGRYLCNAAYWQALDHPIPVLFVHVPKPPRRRPAASRRRPRSGRSYALAEAFVDLGLELLRQSRSARSA